MTNTVCNETTCGECLGSFTQKESDPTTERFIIDLQHKKCKLIQLVRKQIQKFENTQWEPYSIVDESYSTYRSGWRNNEVKAFMKENNQAEDTTLPLHHSTMLHKSTNQSRIPRILQNVRSRISLILAAVIVGILIWISLVYGTFLGASFCGNGRLEVTSFKHSRANHLLF